jgi:hypothetical protein
MNLKRRVSIVGLFLNLIIARMDVLVFGLRLLTKMIDLRTAFIERRTRKVKEIKRSLDSVTQRLRSVTTELETLNGDAEPRKQQLLTARASLLKQGHQLQLAAAKVKIGADWSTAVFGFAETALDQSCLSATMSGDSLCRILSRVESNTFYWDLLLWFLVPGAHSDELLGDLNEEYLLRVSDKGELSAKAWYQHQAVTTIMQYLWKRVERIATVATLIDLIERWLKR